MLGYPSIGLTGSSQIDHTRPLVRRGIVASFNAALKTIIIDARGRCWRSAIPDTEWWRQRMRSSS
jgi:hypothetical protein